MSSNFKGWSPTLITYIRKVYYKRYTFFYIRNEAFALLLSFLRFSPKFASKVLYFCGILGYITKLNFFWRMNQNMCAKKYQFSLPFSQTSF